jgi:DMSO/TMAO reductase YedYZ molybdopterin-dependent catalytic subunit
LSFRQTIRAVPAIRPEFWSFAILHRVGAAGAPRPLILSFANLMTFPTESRRVTIACAGTSADRPLIHEADWRGVPLQALLAEIDLAESVRYARIHSADGYTAVLPFERLAECLLAYEMDGAPLPAEHGFPARVIAPGLYGYKMPKWVERIELSDTPSGGFWESRGYALDGAAGVRVAILGHEQAGGAVALRGVAYAGSQTPESVAVSVDGGGWMPVAFTPGEPFALSHWRIDWTPPGAGDYAIRARAQAGSMRAEHHYVVRVR